MPPARRAGDGGAASRRDPRERLDVILLLERHDAPTRAAAARALARRGQPGHVRAAVVPARGPATKPRACGHGLALARGRMVTVLDAEDRPHPDQLLAAVATLRRHRGGHGGRPGGARDGRPRRRPAGAAARRRVRAVVPPDAPGARPGRGPAAAGGTSNHFPVEALRRAGGWDPFNVAEDADLGVRLARAGYRAGVLDVPTRERPVASPGAWVRQRSRWTKGYAQTWLVCMRRPLLLGRQLGPRGFAHLQLALAGTTAIQLAVPALWACAAAARPAAALGAPRRLTAALRAGAALGALASGAHAAALARAMPPGRRAVAALGPSTGSPRGAPPGGAWPSSSARPTAGEDAASRRGRVSALWRIPGFLSPAGAALLGDLARAQSRSGVAGDLVEIGVFYGRSAVVLGTALRPGERLIACDTFAPAAEGVAAWETAGLGPPRPAFERVWERHVGDPASLTVLQGDSRALPPGALGTGCRLAHVDGDHTHDGARHDALRAEAALIPEAPW